MIHYSDLLFYLEIFAFDNEFSIFGPLDGGFWPSVELALEFGVILLVGGCAARAGDVARRHLDFQLGRHVDRVFRVLRPALVNAHILLRHGINLQTARAHALESAAQMTGPNQKSKKKMLLELFELKNK